jgi:uncharacterized alkaline shock family protein YloU
MMSDKTDLTQDVVKPEGGKIVFATDVIATIAALAAADVKGVAGMSGGMVEGITEMLGRKNITKGVKVEVGTEEVAVDVSVIIQYGFRIQDVCAAVQSAIRNAIETMTGLRAVEINVFVQAITFEAPPAAEKPKKEKPEREPAPAEAPRVK